MKTYLNFLLFFLANFSALGQQVQGVIYYQNSGLKHAEEIKVSGFGCTSVYSNSDGMFTLPCPRKKIGDEVDLVIGPKDLEGKSIEIVNKDQLKYFRIAEAPANNPVEIIICYAGQRNKAALRYYDILANNINKECERQIQELKAENYKNTTTLTTQIDELKAERDAALKKLEEQAQFIASINLDKASELVKAAIQKIEQEEDIDAALNILDDAKLDEAYQIALKAKIKAEEQIEQVVEAYELKISLLLPKFKYADAISCYRRIINIYEVDQSNEETLARLYLRIANILSLNGQFPIAFEYENKAIAIREEILDPNHPDLATAYGSIATTYHALGKFEKALVFHKKAIAILEETLDPNHPDLATAYGNIAITYKTLGKFEQALVFHKKSIAISEEILDPNHPYLATAYNNIAATYKNLGKFEQALVFNRKSIAILEEILDPNHPDLAAAYNNISNAYQALGKFEQTLVFNIKSIAILEEILDPSHPHLAAAYNNIASTYHDLGKFEQALVFNKKDIAILEVILAPNHPDLANAYGNIASTYKALDKLERALVFNKKAIAILEVILDPNHPDLANAYGNIATTYHTLGKFEKALEFHKKAIAIQEKVLDPKHPSLGISYWTIATTLAAIKSFYKAVGYQKKCLAILNEALAENHPYQQQALISLLEIYYARAQDNFSKKNYSKAILDYDTLNSYIENSSIWNSKGLCHFYLSEYPKAIEAYRKAATISPEIKTTSYHNNIGMAYAKNRQFKEAHTAFIAYEKLFPKEGKSQRNWAMYYALQGKKEEALNHLQKAIELGYDDIEWLNSDDSLDSIRNTDEFIEIIKNLKE